jgi:glucosamine-6-phosphate deaminase
MRVVILPTAEEVSRRAADIVVKTIAEKPHAVLGLATGGTPLGTYRQLINDHLSGKVSFKDVTTFNLDEYVGLPPDHPQSYARFMHEQLFSQVDIQLSHCHVPCGRQPDYDAYCNLYEANIRQTGGIDLQLLGIGTDGHIAFNEPGSSLGSRMRLKALTERTRIDNSRFFATLDEVPRLAVTMGVASILDARSILLLATGANKANAVRSFIEGPLTSQIPASALQLHPNVTVLLDEAAAQWLQRRDYYNEVEQIQIQVENKLMRIGV